MWDRVKGTVGKKEMEKYYDPSPGSDEEQQMWERRAARFNQMDRYVILRNPNTGGLGIAVVKENQDNWNNQGDGNDQDSWNNQGSRYHQGFNQEALEEIYENCIEILVSRDIAYARGIYPLKNGNFIAMMVKKIPGGNAFESRPHEICRGIILEESELEFFCHNILAEPEGGAKFFFPDEFDPDHPENWTLPSADELRELNHRNLQYWLDELDYRQVIGLGSALKAVGKENMKIQLALPMEQQESMFSALCCISSLVKERLFILLNGECPMCPNGPDILVTEEIRFDHEVRYSFMNLEDFIAMGLRMSYGLDLADNDDGDEEAVKEKVLSVLELCRDYVTDNRAAGYDVYGAADHRAVRYDRYDTTDHRATEYDVYEAALRLQQDSQKAYGLFREKLRAYLFHLFPGDYCEENYIKLLYLAFRREPDPHDYSLEIKAGPYEFGKMSAFLKKKFKGRTLKRHLSLMVEILFQDQDNAEFFKVLGIKKTLF